MPAYKKAYWFFLLVDHCVDDKIDSGKAGHFHRGFIKRIAILDAVGDLGMGDHFEGVHEFHCFKTGQTRQNTFCAAGIAGIGMGFDESCEYLQVRIEIG